jgi:hypothetical protein
MNAMGESNGVRPEATSSLEPHFQQNSRLNGFRVVQF